MCVVVGSSLTAELLVLELLGSGSMVADKPGGATVIGSGTEHCMHSEIQS